MSKKQRKIFSPTLSNVAVTPVEIKNPNAPEDSKTLRARLRREEEQAKREASPIYQSEQLLNKSMTALHRAVSEFWSMPIEVLGKKYLSESARDLTFSVPALRDQFTYDDARRSFDTWFATTFAKSGYELTEQGGTRLVKFGLAQAKFGADMSNAAAWQTAFEHLKDNLKAFQPGDFAKVPRQVHVDQQASRPSLESLTLEHDADRKIARQIVEEDMYSAISPLHRAWLQSLYDNFNGFVPSEDDLKYIYNQWAAKSNINLLIPKSFDAARRHCVSIGRWPETLLTADERVAREIEQGPALGTLGFDERWRMMSKVQRQRQNQVS